MAEPTCLMRSFSQPSESSRDFNQEGDPARCLGESISFGRYMTEPLAWEKWSTFSHNRYLEEAEKSSKPGSVAKMKAYFEAYYKSISTRKRKAQDEEASRASDMDAMPVGEDPPCSGSDAPQENDSTTDKPRNEINCNLEFSSTLIAPPEEECIISEESLDSSVELKLQCSVDLVQLEAQPSDELMNSVQLERQPPNEVDQLKCTPEVESFKDDDAPDKLNCKLKRLSVSNIGGSPQRKPPISSEIERSKKVDDKESLKSKMKKQPITNTLAHSKPPKLRKFSSRGVASHLTKEGCVTPSNKQQAKNPLHLKALTPTSLHKSIKFVSNPDVKKNNPRIVQKSLTLTPSAKIMKDQATPLLTPNRAPVAGKQLHTSATPQSEIRRSKATPGRSLSRGSTRGPELQLPSLRSIASPGRSFSRGSTRGPELQAPSLNNMKPSSPCGVKLRASISTFMPFNFRTEERAAKRRELFLKQQVKEAEKKIQQTEKAKERVSKSRKLLHITGLKAKSETDFNIKPSSQEKNDAQRLKDGKNDLRRDKPTSLSKKTRHENASPNIL